MSIHSANMDGTPGERPPNEVMIARNREAAFANRVNAGAQALMAYFESIGTPIPRDRLTFITEVPTGSCDDNGKAMLAAQAVVVHASEYGQRIFILEAPLQEAQVSAEQELAWATAGQ